MRTMMLASDFSWPEPGAVAGLTGPIRSVAGADDTAAVCRLGLIGKQHSSSDHFWSRFISR